MKKCFFKLYKNLSIYDKNELSLLAYKLCFFKKKKKFSNNNKKSFQKSFCFFTGVKRSVYNFFNLAR